VRLDGTAAEGQFQVVSPSRLTSDAVLSA